MSDTPSSDTQVTQLKRKLEAAISSRASLENDLKTQSSMLVDFIGKLSQTCKGQDKTLDNKLANLRSLLKKSAALADIEKQISVISQLLQQHSTTNAANIKTLHNDFLLAGKSLQKVNGLPSGLRRDLRALLESSEDEKDAVVQYIPLLSQLVSFYTTVLASKNTPTVDVTTTVNSLNNINELSTEQPVSKEFIEKFSGILNELALSDINTKQLSTVKAKITPDMSNNNLLDRFFEVFDVIVEDLKNERNTAKVFLSTLSETLSTVQSAVKSTLEMSSESGSKHEKINNILQKQVGEMATDINNATSLNTIKSDINDKLKRIAVTLQKKSELEQEQNNLLQAKMHDMAAKVKSLEEQSKTFEKRIQEQQTKSMTDALTKLANRAAFDDYYAKALMKYHSNNFDLAIVVLDLDDFKRINDTYGHTAGDKTLQVIANTLKKQIGEHAFVARYGGEEFVLIMSEINKTQLLKRLDTLRQQIARLPFKFKNDKVSITISVGASHINKEDNTHTAFERADEALYQAKAEGKNQVVYV
ncbi:GGDEF domain-containing protein [Pseudocolwellia agarivorans]|uniref:GGDEF domain-containing protein n=1 Tax=Pseudocolwellia agarivorans TaxID=1911682 RepID=UPI0009856B7F|nr:GGDEF domain-containing protein [Pseudocolwellia agarivorans]